MAPKTNLPFVSSSIPPDLRQFLDRVRETLAGDTFVRRLDYLSGSVPRGPGEPPGPGPNPLPLPCGDPVTPTVPTGFRVFPGFSGFLLQWDMPEYCGHDRTEVYGLRHDGTSDDLTVKNMLGESQGVLYSHVVQRPGDYWCFWIKHVNKNDVEGPFVPAGLCGRTALDPGVLLDTLKQQITESQLYQTLGARINLIDLPGTGLISQNIQRRTEIEDLAQQISEVSVISGNRVFLQSSEPVPGDVCQYNGGVITAANKAVCEALGGTWGHYGLRNGDYWYAIANGYNTPSAAGSVSLKIWAYTNAEYTEGAWGTAATKYLYKQATTPSGATSDLWYDTDSNSEVQWHLKVSSGWQPIVDGFVNIVADARVIDLEQARVGYCVNRTDTNNPVATDYITRESCESQTDHVWYPNLPWATAVKQVSVSTVDKCFIDGGAFTQFCHLSTATTPAACLAAGGTWTGYGTYCVDYDITDSASCVAAGGSWINYNEARCSSFVDPNNKRGTWVLGDSAAIQQKMQTLQDTSGSLMGMYALKIDVGGHVAGFGLSNEVMADGTQISRFLIRADQFGVAGDSYADDVEPTHAKDAWLYPGFTWYDQTNSVTKYWKVTGAGSWGTTIPAFLTQATAPTTFRYLYRVWKDSDDSVIRYFNGTTFSTSRPAAIESDTAPANPFYGQAWWDTGSGALKIYTFPVSWSTDSADASIPFVVQTTPTTDGAVPVPAGVYMDAAFIKDATITTAKIKDLAVDNAKILDLSADKITAGTIGAHTIVMNGSTSIIRSSNWDGSTEGWRIDGSGRAWFYQMDARGGNITGDLGVTGTLTMGTSGSPSSGMMKSWDYAAGSTGWMIQGDGAEFGTLHLRNGAVSTMGYKEVAGPLSALGRNTWVNSHAYVKGNIVWYSSKTSLYYCYVDHTSDTATGKIPTNTSYWVPFNDPDLTSQWSSSTNYGLGTKCWIESTGLVYVSIAASNTNHVPPNSTYWAQLTHFKSLAVTDEIDLSLGNSSLGAIIIGRFLASTTMATGTIPYDRVITDPDFHIRLMFRETGGDRKLLATSGYHMQCVGKTSGGDYQYEAQICDLTRMEGAKKGKVELLLAASMGSTAYDVSTSGIALVHQGLKR